MSHDPRTAMQRVIVDADLSYILLDNYWKWSDLLRQELGKSEEWTWWDMQNRFLYEHKFYTKFMKTKAGRVSEIREELGKKLIGG
jgi:exonuclease III